MIYYDPPDKEQQLSLIPHNNILVFMKCNPYSLLEDND